MNCETLDSEIIENVSESTDIIIEVSLSTENKLDIPNSPNVQKLLKEVSREWNIDLHFATTESDKYSDQYSFRKITRLYTFITKLTKELFMNQKEIALIVPAEQFKQKFNNEKK
uniref:DUF58 domain-containing protein n=1 Tax=Strongyloides papillosus TaxID=174720 RepID=A0A0N5BC23_STREA